MKKLLSVLLSVIMLVSALPLQSFAVSFPNIFNKKIDSVELIGDYPVSAKAVSQLLGHEQNKYYLSNDYQLKINFSDGSEVIDVIDNFVDWEESAASKDLEARVYVKRDECLALAESGADTVPVYIDIIMCNYSISIFRDYDTYNFVTEKELVPCIIDSITVITGAPEKYDGEIDNMLIEITYPDGTKKKAKPVRKIRPDVDIFLLEGERLEYDTWDRCTYDEKCETRIWLGYFDSYTYVDYEHQHKEKEVTYFKGIEITDYEMTDEYILKSVTYTVMWYDGTEKTFTNEFPENEKTEFSAYLGSIDGFSIRIKSTYVEPNYYNLGSRVNIEITLNDKYSSEKHTGYAGFAIDTEPNWYYHFREAFAAFMDAITYPIFKILGLKK